MEEFKYQLVDLGLPSGTLWMDRNIGASSPEDAGLYFAWGETQGYEADEVGKTKQFSWDEYKRSLTSLKTTSDAALQNVHGCSIPTKKQLQELIDGTTSVWTAWNGVYGRLFASNTNGNSIFIPAVGYGAYDSIGDVGSSGGLWSSSLRGGVTNYGWYLYLDSDECYINYTYYRCYGYSVRGVKSRGELLKNKITKEDIVAYFKYQKDNCHICPFDKECNNLMGTYEAPKLCEIIEYCDNKKKNKKL